MSLLDFHADEFATRADNTPREPAPPRPGVPFTWGGAARGIGSAPFAIAAEGMALGVETIGVASQAALYGRKSPDERTGLKLDWSNDLADSIRDTGREWRPDPETTHVAEQILFDATRSIGKLLGYTATLGPAGFVVAGVDEAMAQADELKRKGVDLQTRAKAGAVGGVALGAAGALPMAGATWKATAALYAAGGPGGFIAQQAATRAILKDANYPEIAAGYDPFDPVGLAVSSLVPAPFAYLGMRAASRTAAQRSAPPAVPADTADAARVLHLAEQQRAASLAEPGDLRAAAADQRAQETAAQQLARGERVNVADQAPELSPMARERIRQQIKALDEVPEGTFPARLPQQLDDGKRRAGPLNDERLRDEGVREQLQAMAAESGWGMRGGELIRGDPDEIGEGGMGKVVGRTTWQARAEWYAMMQTNRSTRLPNDRKGVEAAVGKALKGEPMTPQERRAVRYMLEIAREDADPLSGANIKREIEAEGLDDTPDVRVDTALVARAAEIDDAAVERMAVQFEDDEAGFMAAVERFLDEQDARAAGSGEVDQPAAGADPSRPGGEQGDRAGVEGDREVGNPEGEAAEQAATVARLEAIQQQYPDLEVQLDGMDRPVKLAEFLQRVQREAAEEMADAPLYQTAAECALLNP